MKIQPPDLEPQYRTLSSEMRDGELIHRGAGLLETFSLSMPCEPNP